MKFYLILYAAVFCLLINACDKKKDNDDPAPTPTPYVTPSGNDNDTSFDFDNFSLNLTDAVGLFIVYDVIYKIKEDGEIEAAHEEDAYANFEGLSRFPKRKMS